MAGRKNPIVAIDGPAGSGKSTIAKRLAHRLDFIHIDTGALYRGVAWYVTQNGVNVADEAAVVACAKPAKFEFRGTKQEQRLFVNGQDVGDEIRTEDVGALASKISAYSGVRALLLGLQRDLGKPGGAVMEGRDIGSVVFPDAEVKVFLTASLEERARRRTAELWQKGETLSQAEILKQVHQRDEQDIKRAIAPLKKMPDAEEVDTTGISVDDVLDHLQAMVLKRTKP